jgi:cytochrome c biogenesis protein ResB
MIFSPVLKALRSLRLTVLLIICLGSVFLLGVVVPQKRLLGVDPYEAWRAQKPVLVGVLEFLGFTDIYVSPLTLVLWALFFLNLITVMSGRIPVIWRRCMRVAVPAGIESLGRRHVTIPGRGLEDARKTLNGMGYRFFSGGRGFLAVKNRFSPLATILFHLSFLLLLAGGVTTVYTKFRGEANVAVGETFSGNYAGMSKPKVGGVPRTVITVEEVRPVYYKGDVAVDLEVALRTGDGSRRVIGINNPYREGPVSFVIKNIDVAPLFIIRDSNGRELDGAYVKLNALAGNADYFSMAGYDFATVFYTNVLSDTLSTRDEEAALPQALKQRPSAAGARQQQEIVNPAFDLSVYRQGVLLAEETVRVGESIGFDNRTILFSGLAYWVKFYVVKEYGLGVVYTGFALITLALVVRFGFYRRDIKGVEQGEAIHIAGTAEYFSSLFDDELAKISEALRAD